MLRRRLCTTRARLGLVTIVVIAAVLAGAGIAYATSSGITPNTQTVHSGNQVSWTGTWSGTPPYTVDFYYDLGNSADHTHLVTSSTSHTFTYTFYDCTDTTHTQYLQMTDSDGLFSGSESSTVVIHGNIC